jgi:DNA-binding transcriptional ArsR family regulator
MFAFPENDRDHEERQAILLRVLANPHRLKILLLLRGGEMTLGDLAASINITPSGASQHLDVLLSHGMVSKRALGRRTFYASSVQGFDAFWIAVTYRLSQSGGLACHVQ